MAWEDRTSFDAIKNQFDIAEKDVIKIMRDNLNDERKDSMLYKK